MSTYRSFTFLPNRDLTKEFNEVFVIAHRRQVTVPQNIEPTGRLVVAWEPCLPFDATFLWERLPSKRGKAYPIDRSLGPLSPFLVRFRLDVQMSPRLRNAISKA